MPVYKLRHEMPFEEFQQWQEYFERRPVGWRDDDRVSKLLQAQGVKESPLKIFPSLAAIFKKPTKKEGFDAATIPNSSFFGMMKGAKGGDQLPQ